MKTSELHGAALDWAVAKCEGMFNGNPPIHFTDSNDEFFQPTLNWAQGGPIIEREIFKLFRNVGGTYTAQIKVKIPYYSPTYAACIGSERIVYCVGPTPLIAAMRCYVASKLGDDIAVPGELV